MLDKEKPPHITMGKDKNKHYQGDVINSLYRAIASGKSRKLYVPRSSVVYAVSLVKENLGKDIAYEDMEKILQEEFSSS